MARLLRMIRQSRWLMQPGLLGWLPQGAMQSDVLLDLQTVGNKMSVYRVDDDDEFESVVVGLASSRDNFDNLDYAVLDESTIHSATIKLVQTNGNTPCNKANMLHYDLQELTVDKVVKLAQSISAVTPKRMPKKVIESKVRKAMGSGLLDTARLRDSLYQKLMSPPTARN